MDGKTLVTGGAGRIGSRICLEFGGQRSLNEHPCNLKGILSICKDCKQGIQSETEDRNEQEQPDPGAGNHRRQRGL